MATTQRSDTRRRQRRSAASPVDAATNRERTRARRQGLTPAPAPPRGRTGGGRVVAIAFGAAALLALTAIALGALTRHRGEEAPLTAGTAPAEGRTKGLATAPVTIIEYADLQCPNCAMFARTTEREIERQYIETGKVRLEFRHFPFLGKESWRAAEALECAGEQGKLWQYRDALYASQAGENRGAFSDKNLRAIADRAGLDGAALATCLDSGRYRDRVQADKLAGEAAGVEGTPTFFINGRKVVGAYPFSVFQAVIEQALAEGGAGR
jgi:protein-disulfide isomerase